MVALVEAGESAAVTNSPFDEGGVLVADVVAPGLRSLLADRRGDGRPTIVWGGTLAVPRVLLLRDAGASAYVSELARPSELADVVRAVRDGEEVLWPHAPPAGVGLTPREREVAVAYLVTGAERSRADVAAELGMSERTLKVHVARIRDKTGHAGTATREGLRHELTHRGWLS